MPGFDVTAKIIDLFRQAVFLVGQKLISKEANVKAKSTTIAFFLFPLF